MTNLASGPNTDSLAGDILAHTTNPLAFTFLQDRNHWHVVWNYNNLAPSAEGSGGVNQGGEAPAAKRKLTACVPPSLGTINEAILSRVLLPCLDPVGDLKNIFLVNKFLNRNVLRHVHRLTRLLLSPLSADENAKVTSLIGPHFVSQTHAEDIAWKLLCPTKTNKWRVKIKVTADQFVGLDTLPTLEDIRKAREKARIARGVGRGSTGLMFKVTYGENKNICPFLLTSIKSTKPEKKKTRNKEQQQHTMVLLNGTHINGRLHQHL